jgi:signal transduction histidine kinase
MGQELEKNRTELENRVEQRTKQLSTANEDLMTTLNNLQQTQKQLIESEKMAALGGLVAGVAHEINTPIGVGVTAASHIETLTDSLIKQFETDTLKKSDLESYIKDSNEAGKIILTNLTRAAELIRSFKQIAVDQTHDSHRIINVKTYTEECLLSLKPLLKKFQHQVEIICPDNIRINCHPGQYSQIITNLFVNAMRHAYAQGESGHLKLEVHQADELCHFHFSDDGKGIPEADLDKIFDPFFTTARNEGGSGLGLSTIYNIITQNMGGSLRCESIFGQGTSFYFDINPDLEDDREG